MTRFRALRMTSVVIICLFLTVALAGCFYVNNDPYGLDRFGNKFEQNKNIILTQEEIYEKAHDATMTLRITKGNTVRQGSAFFISSDGTFVTNYHVVAEYLEYLKKRGFDDDNTIVRLAALTYAGETYEDFNVIDFSEEKDLAVLQTKGINEVKYLKLKRNGYLNGDDVYVLGSPGGKEKTFLKGKIVKNEQLLNDINCIQISAVLEQGISGSPVLSESGVAIGVATFALDSKHNESYYAVSITELENLIEKTPIYYNGDTNLDS